MVSPPQVGSDVRAIVNLGLLTLTEKDPLKAQSRWLDRKQMVSLARLASPDCNHGFSYRVIGNSCAIASIYAERTEGGPSYVVTSWLASVIVFIG